MLLYLIFRNSFLNSIILWILSIRTKLALSYTIYDNKQVLRKFIERAYERTFFILTYRYEHFIHSIARVMSEIVS